MGKSPLGRPSAEAALGLGVGGSALGGTSRQACLHDRGPSARNAN